MKLMLIGRTCSGKTTLKQAINNEEIKYRKTQSLEYSKNILDTPGEYVENRRYYNCCKEKLKKAEKHLKEAGVREIFYVDSISGRGIEEIRRLLQ